MKILIVKIHSIGDLLIASPAISRIRSAFPNAELHLLTAKWTAPAGKANRNLDHLIVARDRLFFHPGIRTVGETLRLLSQLRKDEYGAAVIFHRHRMIDTFIAASGVQVRFRFNGGNDGRSVFLDEGRHSALTAWELADLAVNALGGASVEPPDLPNMSYDWEIAPEDDHGAALITGNLKLSLGQFIAVFPGGGANPHSSDQIKQWGPTRFADLMERIRREHGLEIILLGGKTDQSVCRSVTELTKMNMFDLSGKCDLETSVAIMSRARLIITNDSAPLHIAAAVKTPVVGLFGPTGARHKLPPGRGCYSASSTLSCSPCYFTFFKGCLFDRIRCMEELSVEHVKSVVDRALEGSDDKGPRV